VAPSMANAAPDVQSCVVLPVVEAEREFIPFRVHWAATGEVERGNRIVADASHVWVYADGATQSASTIEVGNWVRSSPSTPFRLGSALPFHSCRGCCAAVEGESVPGTVLCVSSGIGGGIGIARGPRRHRRRQAASLDT